MISKQEFAQKNQFILRSDWYANMAWLRAGINKMKMNIHKFVYVNSTFAFLK